MAIRVLVRNYEFSALQGLSDSRRGKEFFDPEQIPSYLNVTASTQLQNINQKFFSQRDPCEAHCGPHQGGRNHSNMISFRLINQDNSHFYKKFLKKIFAHRHIEKYYLAFL